MKNTRNNCEIWAKESPYELPWPEAIGSSNDRPTQPREGWLAAPQTGMLECRGSDAIAGPASFCEQAAGHRNL